MAGQRGQSEAVAAAYDKIIALVATASGIEDDVCGLNEYRPTGIAKADPLAVQCL